MADDTESADSTQVRKIKSENELDQIDDSMLDQVSGGRMNNDEEEEEQDQMVPFPFDPTSIIE